VDYRMVARVLGDAEALIADEARWTTHRPAADAAGQTVGPSADEACRWCAFGAICKAARALGADIQPAVYLANKYSGAGTVISVNDDRGHAAVLGVLREARADAERRCMAG
jgi:hypothetical protein